MTAADSPNRTPRVGRRTVVAAVVACLGAPALTSVLAACSPASSTPDATTPARTLPPADRAAVDRAVATSRQVLAGALALRPTAGRGAAKALDRLVGDTRAHLTALGSPDGGPAATTTATPAATPPPAARSVAGLVRAQSAGAAEAVEDALTTTPDLAALLARLAGARAASADVVARAARVRVPGALPGSGDGSAARPSGPSASAVSPSAVSPSAVSPSAVSPSAASPSAVSPSAASPSPSPTQPAAVRDALGRLVAGEHAAVFAYGLVTARAPRDRRDEADAAWRRHVARRDRLEQLLLDAGVQPPPAQPAYDVGRPPATGTAALELGARAEDGVAALAARAVATTTGELRREAALTLVEAARTSAAWRGRAARLPGG